VDRAELLRAAGAPEAVLDELLAYDAPLLPGDAARSAPIPEDDERHLEAWGRYLEEAAAAGVVPALARRLPQLRFPVREGISATESYRAATREGIFPADGDPEASGLPLVRPDLVSLTLHPTLAGRFPVLVAGERPDFENLVRAFAARNEPVPVPASMGACLVKGFNNWDRLNTWRASWEAAHPDGDWEAEWPAVVERKELYEDRFVVLSSGPYSGVPAADAGFPEPEWRDLSLRIRRDHEATHYLTLRAAGLSRNNLLDEVLADWVGLVRTFGRYDERLALLFFGLERYPAYREGARLENYRGKPPLSDAAFDVVKRLVHDAVRNLAAVDAETPRALRDGPALARRVLLLASYSLAELAAPGLSGRLARLAPSPDLALEVRPDLDGVAAAGEAFARFAADHGVPGRTIADLRVVLDEILSNVVKYAFGKRRKTPIGLEARVSEGLLTLTVADRGRAFDPLARAEPDVAAPLPERPVGGLGILLVKRLTDSQSWTRAGGVNRLTLTKRLDA
jgi:anti-sigma regulatory factor (Ser/Thr protein kinase)